MMNFVKDTIKNYMSGSSGSYSSSSSQSGQETWYITAVCAEGIKDKDRFSKSDPYLKIYFGGKTVKTRTIKNDRTPQWNETFSYKLRGGTAKDIQLTLMDSDIGLDDTIGTTTVSIADLPVYSGEEKYLKVPVFRKQQITGIVHLRVKKIIEGVIPYQQPPSGYQQPYSQPYPPQSQSSGYTQPYSAPPLQQPYQYPQQQYQQPPPQQYYPQQQPHYQQNPQQSQQQHYHQGNPSQQYRNPY
jgi:hypothetical protein